MGQTKEKALENAEWIVRISDEVYRNMTPEGRAVFLSEKKIYPLEHKVLYETDPHYRDVFRMYREAKQELDEYMFNKRNR